MKKEQEVYNALADIHTLALKVIKDPDAYAQFEDEFYQANKSLGDAWMALRAVQRSNNLQALCIEASNRSSDEAMIAKLKIAGL